MIRNSGQGAKRRAIVETRTVTMPAGRSRTQRHPTGPGGCTARPPVHRGSSDGRAVRPADGPKALRNLCVTSAGSSGSCLPGSTASKRGDRAAPQQGSRRTATWNVPVRAPPAGPEADTSKSHSCRCALARFATGPMTVTSADVADLPAGEPPPAQSDAGRDRWHRRQGTKTSVCAAGGSSRLHPQLAPSQIRALRRVPGGSKQVARRGTTNHRIRLFGTNSAIPHDSRNVTRSGRPALARLTPRHRRQRGRRKTARI